MRNLCLIGLGSNIGDRLAHLQSALRALNPEAVSSLYETQPVGGPPQPDYLNACAIVSTTDSPLSFLTRLQHLEHAAHRIRSTPNAPRTLDLDLLLIDNLILNHPRLTLPHPRLHLRAFVLDPATEIAPHWIHPTLHQSLATCRAALKDPTPVHLIHPPDWWEGP